jgi:multiple sugar transport system substrate-binding protein
MFKKFLTALTLLMAALFATTIYAKTELTVVFEGTATNTEWMDFVKKEFEKTHPGIELKYLPTMGKQGNYPTKLTMLLKNDTSIDVVSTSPNFYSFIEAKALAPLNEIKKWDQFKEFYPNYIDSGTIDGNIYGIPYNTSTFGLWYNKRYFKEVGLPVPWNPKNWNDIYNACEVIKKKLPKVWPIWMYVSSGTSDSALRTGMNLLLGTDSSLFKDGKWVVTSKGLFDTLSFINKIFRARLTPPLQIMTDMKATTGGMVDEYAPEQKVAIMLDGNWITKFWTKKRKTYAAKENYTFTPLPTQFGQAPGHVSVLNAWYYAINAKSSHKKEGLEFIKFLTSPKSLDKMVEIMNSLTTRKDIKYPKNIEGTEFTQYSISTPKSSEYSSVFDMELRKAVENVALGMKSPEDAMNSFADNVEISIGDNKVIREYKK